MRSSWRTRGADVFTALFGVGLNGLILGVVLLSFSAGPAQPESARAPVENAIVRENALPGTRDWQIPDGKGATTQIQAYTSATSALPGQALIFYTSTQKAGTRYSIGIYRLGWYGGMGGRLMLFQAKLVGRPQGYYDESKKSLTACASCRDDTRSGLIEANWRPSYKLIVPAVWTTGVYLAKFIDAGGMQTYVPFDVRGNASSTYVAVTQDTTNAAYNDWGGYSLYVAENDNGPRQLGRAVKASFDRPYQENFGSGHVLDFEADAIRWLERQGYDLSYISSVDLHEDPGQLLHHRAYLSLGHDEYWSKQMRDGVEQARNHRVGLAFLGADASYWQIRFEPDGHGTPDRTIVCYKVESGDHDLARDPLYGRDDSVVTAQWRDPVLNRPENALIGIMYSSLTDSEKQPGFPWRVSPSSSSSLLAGTGLVPGRQYGCDLVGYEWDRAFNNGASPRDLQVLAASQTVSEYGNADASNTTSYIAPSGAMVFASGSIYWAGALDSYRLSTDEHCAGQSLVVPGIQRLMANVMQALIEHW